MNLDKNPLSLFDYKGKKCYFLKKKFILLFFISILHSLGYGKRDKT